MPSKRISDIVIKRNRCRKEMGDITSLAASIEHLGQLQPVGIRADNTLVCGARRIQALKTLGRDKVEVYVCRDLSDELRFLEAERDENTCRLQLTPLEAEDLARRLKPKYEALAKQRQQDGGSYGARGGRGKKKTHSRTSTKGKQDDTKRSARQAAASTGYSADTIKKVTEIRDAAKTDKAIQSIADKLNDHGARVDAIYKEYKKALKAREDKKAAAAAKRAIRKTPDNGVYHGDAFKLADNIPDESCALVFTDPPYDRESLPMFEKLSELSSRILVQGGSLVTYGGQYVLPAILEHLSHHLTFFWICCCQHTGGTSQMREYGIKVKWKPMLWFVKGDFRRDRSVWVDDLVISKPDKSLHPWQQSIIEAKHFIESLTTPGEMVVDPFCGGGTTAMAAKQLGRIWWTADKNARHVKTARQRIS